MKRQFATYVKTQLNSTATSPMAPTSSSNSSNSEQQQQQPPPAAALGGLDVLSPQTPPQPPAYRSSSSISNNSNSNISNSNSNFGKTFYYRTLSAASSSSSHTTSQSTSPTTEPLTGTASGTGAAGAGGGIATSGFLRRYASSGGSISTPPSPHLLAGLDRRHRSPDPPPRYNRGQSPLLLRKNLLELGGQTPGSPMLQRR